ncbi:MAG: cbb3-type cytochrome oxidase assembly protein CcoS [Bdellovibrionales bacterium]|nr:cbb3-type cytochrome oxidase assembly protein CcoS [Bdellovibrionales bacterium]
MTIVYLLAPLSLLLAGGFVLAFFRAVDDGQFQDLDTPALRALLDAEPEIDHRSESISEKGKNDDRPRKA